MTIAHLLMLAAAVNVCLGFPSYVPMFPNVGVDPGDGLSLVPAPFNISGALCQSIGHVAQCAGSPSGAGNPFGQAWIAQGSSRVWAPTFCMLDSDGDGVTNGVELGDPLCVWVMGATPAISTGLSHPGFPCSTAANPNCLDPPPPTTQPPTTPPPTTPPATTQPPTTPQATTPQATTPQATTSPAVNTTTLPPPPFTTPPPPSTTIFATGQTTTPPTPTPTTNPAVNATTLPPPPFTTPPPPPSTIFATGQTTTPPTPTPTTNPAVNTTMPPPPPITTPPPPSTIFATGQTTTPPTPTPTVTPATPTVGECLTGVCNDIQAQQRELVQSFRDTQATYAGSVELWRDDIYAVWRTQQNACSGN